MNFAAMERAQKQLKAIESQYAELDASQTQERDRLLRLSESLQSLRGQLAKATSGIVSAVPTQQQHASERAAVAAELAEVDRLLIQANEAVSESTRWIAVNEVNPVCERRTLLAKHDGAYIGEYDPASNTVSHVFDGVTYTQPYPYIAALDKHNQGVNWKFVFTGESPETALGDEALEWSTYDKLVEAARIAFERGLIPQGYRDRYLQVLEMFKNPGAMARFMLLFGGLAALKKLACSFLPGAQMPIKVATGVAAAVGTYCDGK